eukprot:6989297-Prymnesium_polylepis.1
MPIAELLEALRAGGALVRFDGEVHFDPFARAELAPTEPADPRDARAALDDLGAVPEAVEDAEVAGIDEGARLAALGL